MFFAENDLFNNMERVNMGRTKGSSSGIKSQVQNGKRYYYTYFQSKQVSLGSNPEEAKQRYRTLLATSGSQPVNALPPVGKGERPLSPVPVLSF